MMANVISAESPITRALSVPSASPSSHHAAALYAIALAAQRLDQRLVAAPSIFLRRREMWDVDTFACGSN